VFSDSKCRPTIWYLTRASADVPSDNSWLGPRESQVLSGLRFSKRREDWRLGRWTAKLAARGSGVVPAQSLLDSIEILAAADGAPESYLSGQRLGVSLSLSHSAGMSLCFVSPGGISLGCDIERVEPRDPAFADDYFTAAEAASLAVAPAAEQTLLLNLVWSAKESLLKALREGLRRDTRTVAVEWDCSESLWKPLRGLCLLSGLKFEGWWSVAGGFVITVLADRLSETPVPVVP
jgi:4'-phosphopantetheinyl transferase